MKKFVKFIFKLLLILIIAFVGIFFGKGYWGYLELTKSQSVDDVVSEVTSRSTFVGYDDLSPELVRATVAIVFMIIEALIILGLCVHLYPNLMMIY